jgi:hypothetical protein
MAGPATTLPLPGAQSPVRGPLTGARPPQLLPAPTLARAGAGRWVAAIALASIPVLSVVAVLMTAERPSVLSPTTHTNFFPDWMSGPLGGLWPSLTSDSNTLKYAFTAVIVAMFVGYLVLLRNLGRLSGRWVIAAIVAVHAVFLLAPPMALTDVFNYINYGRMEVVHHLNPYTSIPIVEPHNDPSFVLSNWHQLLSPYGPLFTMLTFALVPLGVAASFWTIKALLALASLAMLTLVWRCARLLGRDPVMAVALVGLNPIVLVWGLGGDHNDFLMLFCIVLGFYLLLLAAGPAGVQRRRHLRLGPLLVPVSPLEIGAGAAFVTAAAFKASGGILLPVVLASRLRAPRSLAQVAFGMLLAGGVLGLASLYAFGLHIPDLSTQGRLVTAESVPNLVGLAVGAGGETETLRLVMSLILAACVLACCRLAYLRREPIVACGWASVALLLTLSWVLPWYVLWVLPLAAIGSSERLRRTALVLGVYLFVAWAPASGLVWNAIGFHPERTPLGRLHQRYVRELLN